MKKQTLLYISIGVLVALNLWLIGGRLFHPHRPDPREHIIEALHLAPDQIQRYDQLIARHREGVRAFETELVHLRESLYSHLNADTAGVGAIRTRIASLESDAEMLHYRHFEELRALCTPEQLPAFDALKAELAMLFQPPHPRERRE
jgi:periplasmic protein CpxP/Spy